MITFRVPLATATDEKTYLAFPCWLYLPILTTIGMGH